MKSAFIKPRSPDSYQISRDKHHPTRRPTQRPLLPLALVIALDILFLGIGLVTFALFHHVLPRDVGKAGQVLPRSTVILSDNATGTIHSDILAPEPLTGPDDSTASTTAAATAEAKNTGGFAEKFKDRFTSGAVEQTETTYKSANINVTLQKVQKNGAAYIVTDIYVSDIRFFKTAFATGKYGRGLTDSVLHMAAANKAIVALSGDYFGIRDKGIVIRNGVLYRDSSDRDVMILNNDGSMATFTATEFNIESVQKQGAWQSWSFGPMLLKDGKPMTAFNSDVPSLNPRSAIGYYEPGHYCFVLVDGRHPGYSDGMTLKQLSQLFYDLGCKVAYNLDGGQSAVMTFKDKVASSPYADSRNVSDIVYIADQ